MMWAVRNYCGRGGVEVTETTLTYTNELPREHNFYDLYQSTEWNSQGSYTPAC